MRKEYDFSTGRRSRHAARTTSKITIALDREAIAYFKALSSETGVPYRSLINLYLRECVATRRRLRIPARRPNVRAGASATR